MTGLLLALLLSTAAGFGARDQITIAALAERLGPRLSLIAVGAACSVATAALAAWAGSTVLPMLVPKARLIMAAIALGLAGGEQLLLPPAKRPQEPTHSLFAMGIVILAHQVTDATRFVIFAIAVATSAPIAAAIGGAAGGVAVLAAGWFSPDLVQDKPFRTARRAIGAVLLAIALVVAFTALG